MFGNIGLVAAKETPSSHQPVLAATTGAGLAASGWLPQQQRCLPPTTSILLSNNNTKASCGAGGGGMATGGNAASGGVVSGRTPQVMLNNKMDLMASVRLARRTMADGKMNQNTMSLGPRRLPLQEAASLSKVSSLSKYNDMRRYVCKIRYGMHFCLTCGFLVCPSFGSHADYIDDSGLDATRTQGHQLFAQHKDSTL